jgi:hypothetical protein
MQASTIPAYGLGRRRFVNDHATAFDACARITRLAVLDDTSGVIKALHAAGHEAHEFAMSLHRHQLGPLVRQALASPQDGSVVTAQAQAVVDQLPTVQRATSKEYLDAFAIIRDALEDAGIPVLLLKGAVLACLLYDDLDRRPQYDLDLLVPRRQARRARRALTSMGYRRRSRDGHSVSFVRGQIHVDLHHALRSSPAYAIDEAHLWGGARPDVIAGTSLRTLADSDTLTLLTMSLVEDVGFGMAKLKNLCDTWLLVRELDAMTDWELWFTARKAEHLEAIAVNGCALALEIMGAPSDAPRMAEALNQRRSLIRLADRDHALALMTSGRGSPDNMAWLGEVYPGSLLGFRLYSLVAGLPATLKDVRLSPRFQMQFVRSRRATRRATRVAALPSDRLDQADR